MPFEMLFGRGLHQSNNQGRGAHGRARPAEAYDLLGLKDPDFQPFEITDRSRE